MFLRSASLCGAADIADEACQYVLGPAGIGDGDLDATKCRIRRAGHRLVPCEKCARLGLVAVALSDRRAGCLELRGGQPVLRDPQRERAALEGSRTLRALCDAAEAGGQRHGDDRQRDQDLDERETAARRHEYGQRGVGPMSATRFRGSAASRICHSGEASAIAKGSLRPLGESGSTASLGTGAPAYKRGIATSGAGSARGASTSSSESASQVSPLPSLGVPRRQKRYAPPPAETPRVWFFHCARSAACSSAPAKRRPSRSSVSRGSRSSWA